ncbi:MAG: GNAT family N-acetyltransferase [Bacilli bacterium]|nr:GNAT family N-acetyltransferase [Bacilli bacterium]
MITLKWFLGNYELYCLNGKDIGFYNGIAHENGSYEIENICLVPEYQGKGIGTQVLTDIMELHKDKDIHIQYFKQNPVGELYKKLGFIPNGETEYHYQMTKSKQNSINNDAVKGNKI